MRIGYVTTDEVNLAWAALMARKCGAVVRRWVSKLAPPDGTFDAILYDMDDVPRFRQGEILAQLLRARSTCPRAVHGYALSEDEAASLRMQGVVVAQRLQLELFRILCRAVRQQLASVPPDDALLEETWISLAE
jgi:hypothetical protein